MDEFLIQSADGEAQFLFFDRIPFERGRPIDTFSVRITDLNLSATAGVYAGYANSHPAPLFAEMARQWRGWPDELTWQSLEHELALHCTHDKLGHIRIGIQLGNRTRGWEFQWEVRAAVIAEAGQLDRLAWQAAEFFGEPS